MKFQNSNLNFVTDAQMDGRTDRRTNMPKAICPSTFFKAGGIKSGFQINHLCSNHFSLPGNCLYEINRCNLSKRAKRSKTILYDSVCRCFE